MKVTISTPDLKEALGISQSTLGTSSDITSHFVFIREDSGASVMSCSPPRLFSKVPLTGATVQENGSFSLDGKRTLKAINATSGVLEIEFEENEGNGDVSIQSTKGSLSLPSLDPSTFPSWMDKLSEAEKVKDISSTLLYDTINSLKGYVSQDESRRPELAMLAIMEDGNAFACDGFSLGVARHNDFKDLDVKLHFKDLTPLMKFLKSYDGNVIEVLKGGSATFFRAEDGAVFGTMDIPHTFPQVMLQYAEAFNWTPRRVWRLTKESISTGINFLSAGADSSDLRVTFTHAEGDMGNPVLEMSPANGKGTLTYSLEVPPFDASEYASLEDITDPGDRMYYSRLTTPVAEGEADIESFKFNYLNMKRALETMGDNVVVGCNQEGNKGYMVFKGGSSSGVETVAVIGWMV